jgi:hypothetical protein
VLASTITGSSVTRAGGGGGGCWTGALEVLQELVELVVEVMVVDHADIQPSTAGTINTGGGGGGAGATILPLKVLVVQE